MATPLEDIDREIKLYEGWKNICAALPETAESLQRIVDKLYARKKLLLEKENALPKTEAPRELRPEDDESFFL